MTVATTKQQPTPGKTPKQQALKRSRQPAQVAPDPTQDYSGDADPYDDKEGHKAILESRVNRRIYEAMQARASSGIEEIWAEDEDQYNGVDALSTARHVVKTRDQLPKKKRAGAQSTLYLNVTAPKTDIAVARVQEMLVPHDDKPWETGRTPVPDIDEAVERSSQTPVQLGDGTQVAEADVAELMNHRADEAAKKEALWIEDKFVEGSVYAEMRKVIRDAGRLGTGILKGPIPVERITKKWSVRDGAGLLDITKKIDPTSRRIRVQDFFPAPDCGDNVHKGSYCVERDFLTGRALADLAALPDYDTGAIALALEEGPRLVGRGSSDVRRDNVGDTFNDARLYEVYYYYGQVDPEDLVMMGLDRGQQDGQSLLGEEDLIGAPVAAILTMVNGRAVKCALNPLETGTFPYDLFPWDIVDGQPWGRGIPRKVGVGQRGLNAGVRKMMENAGLSGGPQIVFDCNAVEPEDGIYEITGRKLWRFNASDAINDIQKAFASFDIPSMQPQLQGIVQFWLEMIDILSNLPILMQGMLKEGATPETLGGMRLLMANMTSPLKVIAKQYDDYLIVPHLGRYHDWYMQDPSIPAENKGDTQIRARGATALVQRAEDSDFLVMLWASKDDPSLDLDPKKLIAEIARARGFNIKTVQYAPDEAKAKAAERAQQQPPQDPRVQAAQIRNEGIKATNDARAAQAQADMQFKAEQADADRQAAERLHQFEIQIEMMRMQGDQQISFADMKAMLAGKAMDARLKSDEMQMKLAPQNTSGTGI